MIRLKISINKHQNHNYSTFLSRMWIKKVFLYFFMAFIYASSDSSFEVDQYDIELDTNLHQGNFNFSGIVTIKIKMKSDAESVKFYHKNLNIEEIHIDERKENASNLTNEFVEVKLETGIFLNGIEYGVKFIYEGTFPNEFIGNYKDENNVTVNFLMISFKSTTFSTICPTIESHTERSNFLIQIKHDQDYNVLSNGDKEDIEPQTRIGKTGDEKFVTKFMKMENFLTSSIAIFISNFKSISSKKAKIFGIPNFIDEGAFDVALNMSEKIINEYNSYFPNTPLEKINIIAIPDLTSAISFPTLIYHNQFNLFYQPNKTPLNQIDKITRSMAHAIFVSCT